ncbi:hypothetical protein BH09PSE6_BH09PSE6_29430 [soil metagenome]
MFQAVEDQRFRCLGLFYDWRDDRDDFAKRAVLEILQGDEPDSRASKPPDAVVVMMNPGSSMPLPGHEGRGSEGRLVPTKPDSVQRQIMRLMARVGWHHVRVVNLADVRAARSADLHALIDGGADRQALGSMFAGASVVAPGNAIDAGLVICAWGMDKRLAPYATQAQQWLDEKRVRLVGMRAPAARFPAWRYPKPVGNWSMAVEWLEVVERQVREASAAGTR